MQNPSTDQQLINQLCTEHKVITKAGSATPGCRALAALVCAASCARRAGIPAATAAALLADYMGRDDPA